MRTSLSDRPVIAVTMGDPAGIGAEVTLKSLLRRPAGADFLIIGDHTIFRASSRRFGISLPLHVIKDIRCVDFNKRSVNFLDCSLLKSNDIRYGRMDLRYAKASMAYIRKALLAVSLGKADAIVTAPVNKAAIRKAGFKWMGHTEMIAKSDGCARYAMMLIGGPLRVALATTHIPLRAVHRSISAGRIKDIIILTDEALRRYFGIRRPRIGVASINPHAGEGGFVGDEERKIILPAVKAALKKGVNVTGPSSSEALFYAAYRGDIDAVVSMYHDQGLTPLKMISQREGVNLTLGLSFVRTSASHGTAYDIAGKGIADEGSMRNAVMLAADMVKRRR